MNSIKGVLFLKNVDEEMKQVNVNLGNKGNMKEKLKIGNQMEQGILITSLELSMLGNGRMGNIMVKGHTLGLMDKSMKENLRMEKMEWYSI